MRNIIVNRKMAVETNEHDIKVGDQIQVPLCLENDKVTAFTATAHKIVDNSVLFIFDDYIATKPMNKEWSNVGGYEKSDLKKWIDTELLKAFPEDMRERICDLSIPTVGEIFGQNDDWCNEVFDMDTNEQLELMKNIRYRIAFLNNGLEWGWLRNKTKDSVSAANFASVGGDGIAACSGATLSGGVRPEFWLVK